MIGETLGSYRVKEEIGRGGMGAVFLAVHPLIGRKVAVKMLRPEYSDNEEAVSRFFREARATASLRHPALIDVFDYGVHSNGSAYIIMDYLEGETLESRLRNGKLSLHCAVDFARQIALGMAAAHAAGIIHRDLKPGNVFIVPDPTRRGADQLKILDFGIAKLTNRDGPQSGKATRTDLVMGTPLYMSPEQCRGGGNVDVRADIYSLGCIMFEMICGQLPFMSSFAGELIIAHVTTPPPSPRSIDPSIPPGVEAIILRSLAKAPEQRQQSMDEMVAEIDAYVASDPSWQVAAHGSGPPPAAPGAAPLTPFPGTPNAPQPASASASGSGGGTVLLTPNIAGAFSAAQGQAEKPVNASTLTRGASTREVLVAPAALEKKTNLGTVIASVAGFAALVTLIVFFVAKRGSHEAKNGSPAPLTLTSGAAPRGPAPEPSSQPAPSATVAMQTGASPAEPAESATPPSVEPVGSALGSTAPAPSNRDDGSNAIKISIPNARRGLTVRVDGKIAPIPLRIPRDGRVHDLSFDTPNFRPESRRITADKDQTIVLLNKPGLFVQ